jgi:hypothetical protein
MMSTTKTVMAMLAALALTVSSGLALAAPNEIHTQGILRDTNGDLMEGEVALTFRIYDAAVDGEMLWEEAVTVNVMGGVFDVLLPADPDNVPFPDDLFVEDGRWLAIMPADQAELPRTSLASVPYALQASMAGNLQCSGCIGSDEVDFNFAASDAPGGAATSALTANEALVANNVACEGCVTLQAIDAAVLMASNVGYNNELSGLAAANVQEAIDENALAIVGHVNDMEIHGSGSGKDGAKVRVVANDATVVSGQVATEFLYVFSADAPKVYLYAHGRATTEGENADPGGSGGTVAYTRCAWTGGHAKAHGSCSPPACPENWQDLGITGSAKTGSSGTGYDYYKNTIDSGTYNASSGYQERACYYPKSFAVVQPRCPWTGGHAKAHGSCTPPPCPSAWTDWGVTGTVKTGSSGTGYNYYKNTIDSGTYNASSGYQERTCVKETKSEIPQGVQIWVDGADQTVAIGDQQGKGDPAWTGDAWGADGTTSWSTGRLDLSQIIDWGVGEHTLQFKTTGESGGKIQYYVFFVDPAAESQPFPNDSCAGAEAMVFNGGVATVNGTTEDMLGENKALDDLSPAQCGGEGGADVVYTVTVEERTTIKAAVKAPFATRLYILGAPCTNEVVLACGTTSVATAELDPGVYYVVVDSDAADQTGDFSLTVELEASPLPANDTCDTLVAIDAGPEPTQVTGTTKWGLNQYDGTCGGEMAAEVVYSFEATDVNDDLLVTIDAPFVPVMVLMGQNCSEGFQLSCSATGTLAIPGLAPGTYYLFVDGKEETDEGAFTLNVTLN